MQAPTALTTVGAVVGLAVLAMALTVFASAFVAVPIFLVGLVVFLVWRGKQRARTLQESTGTRVPTTEEAAADPAGDSGVRDAARSSTSHAP
jgi:ABC-type xylose transport system permease subunit